MEAHKPSLWQRVTKFNEALVGSNIAAAFIVVLLCVLGGVVFAMSSAHHKPSLLSVDQQTYEQLRSHSLISSDDIDSFTNYCETYILPREDGSRAKAERVCSCTFGAAAQVALTNNQSFASVLGEIADGKRGDLECSFASR